MKPQIKIASALFAAAVVLAACSSPNTPNNASQDTTTTQASLAPIEVDNVPAYAIKPTNGAVSITGHMRVPANLILSDSELSNITAPPLGVTAPPLGVTAPPLGVTAPPLGVLPAQPIFGILSQKTQGASAGNFASFFNENFSLKLGSTQAFIHKTVLQYINNQPFFVASYAIPKVEANQSVTLKATHPFLSLSSSLQTGPANQTLASDLDFGSTAVDLVKAAAQKASKSVDFAYLNQHLNDLEDISNAMKERFNNQMTQAQLDAKVDAFVATLPAASTPQSIEIQGVDQSLDLKMGASQQLVAKTLFANQQSSQATLWRSSQGDVVNVLADGTLVAVKPGKATIYATAVDNPEVTDSLVVEVK